MFKGIIGKVKYWLDKEERKLRDDLKKIIGYYPINLEYYKIAFIHKSASYIDHQGKVVNNERLEFLGDAILGAVVGDFLFRQFPGADEGFLTQTRSKLVNRKILSNLAIKIGINQFIITHIKKYKINKHIPGNALEAFIGAVYLDLGYKKTRNFIIRRLFYQNIDIAEVVNSENNYKSKILEWAQQQNAKIDFNTSPINNHHSPIRFKSEIFVNNEYYGQGTGDSKKEAEQEAAKEAYQKLNINKKKIHSFHHKN